MACRFICVITLLAVSALPARAGSNDLFRGGSFDGHARSTLIAFAPPADINARYQGGVFDGHASRSLITHVEPTQSVARFRGGSLDGHAALALITFDTSLQNARFRGGFYDGHAFLPLITFNAALVSARFRGGFYDGHNLAMAGPYSNPLDFDTDSDGIPDWWEVPYFGNLTGAVPNIDQDNDGDISWIEYTADTNPNDSSSVWRVRSIASDGMVSVSYISSAIRLYDFEYAANLVSGPWTPYPGQTNHPGVGGLESFVDSSTTARFYRIRVKIP
jgi:hypothetical protein